MGGKTPWSGIKINIGTRRTCNCGEQHSPWQSGGSTDGSEEQGAGLFWSTGLMLGEVKR